MIRFLAASLLLALLFAQPASAQTDVWLDVDVAAGMHERDVDDAVAMIQAFHSPEINVRGVSAVYGNSPLADGVPIAREVIEKFGPEGLQVYAGAASAKELGESNAAVEAMAAALREKPFTLLALGPVTNVGSLLRLYPDVHDKIESIVMVAARRPGQRFTYPEANGAAFQDFNFENDAEAMQIILDSKIDLVFAPWEVSSHIWITPEDLQRLSDSGGSGAWIAEKSQSWIAMWQNQLNQRGFNPFDTLGVGWVTHPQLMESMQVTARIEQAPDDTVQPTNGRAPREKPYLLVEPTDADDTRRIVYAYRPKPEFKQILLERLAGK